MGQNQVSLIERGVLCFEGPFSEVSLYVVLVKNLCFSFLSIFSFTHTHTAEVCHNSAFNSNAEQLTVCMWYIPL